MNIISKVFCWGNWSICFAFHRTVSRTQIKCGCLLKASCKSLLITNYYPSEGVSLLANSYTMLNANKRYTNKNIFYLLLWFILLLIVSFPFYFGATSRSLGWYFKKKVNSCDFNTLTKIFILWIKITSL